MALESPDATFDPFPAGSQLERVPDSSSLRVSTNTQYESGIPPARVREELSLQASEERVELALAGVSRTEANLGQLIRGLKHLAAGAGAAQAANLELMHELDELRAHLVHVNEEEVALRYRMTQLEQLLDLIRHESSRERDFLIEQQDLFLVEIMSDHDRQIADLRRSLREASNRKADAREVAELVAQRDQAREYATRCERERDLAWQELASGHAPTPTPTPTPTSESGSARKSAPTAIGSISLKAVSISASQLPDTERQATGYSLSGDDISK
ncbi:MAG TPA: hypothetical protein VK745_00760 [Polyangiaceae bacterium]|nr:hypothetical protein [Polyangiaceae bacterium]